MVSEVQEPAEVAAGPEEGKRGWSRRRKVLTWAGGSLAVLVALAVGGGTYAYFDLQGNIHHDHAGAAELGTNRPAKLNQSTNILLMGSDSRAGANSAYADGTAGARSDTTILLHLSPNGNQAVGISFPRDSMVQIPACKTKGGMTRPSFGMLNAAYAEAGPVCTWKMIEQDTGIHIDHFVEIDFAGFKNVVNALGGVEICVPKAIVDPRANLALKAGRQVVKGDQALGYVRTRYVLGDGSDLERIRRQQMFMASVVKKSLSAGTLTNPIKTYRLLSAVTKSITTDDGLTLPMMEKLAGSVKGMAGGKVRFVTVPNHAYPKDPNRVEWDATAAKALFESIRQDNSALATAAPAASPSAASPSPAPPQQVTVLAATAAKARTAGQQLTGAGLTVGTTGKAKSKPGRTRVYYGAGAGQQARAVAAKLGLKPVAEKGAAKNTVYVEVGTDGLKLPAAPLPPAITASDNLCGS